MPKFNYVAMDSHAKETKGTMEVASRSEALGRLKEMGLFVTNVVEAEKPKEKGGKKAKAAPKKGKKGGAMNFNIRIPWTWRQGQVEGVDNLHAAVGHAG